MGKIRVQLKRSLIGRRKDQIATIKALGLKKIGNVVEHETNPSILGMINKVKFLLEVKEI